MAVLDPYDAVVYRALVGRFLYPIEGALDRSRVVAGRIAGRPPKWSLEPWQVAINGRRERARNLIENRAGMAVFDVERFYPSIKRHILMQMFDHLPVHRATADFLDGWLERLDLHFGVKGLPTGQQPSMVLANGLLAPADAALNSTGSPFLRYVDDVWSFLAAPGLFVPMRDLYAESLATLGLELNSTKTAFLDWSEASELIDGFADDYATSPAEGEDFADSPRGVEDLFEWALADPLSRRSQLRRALGGLGNASSLRPFQALNGDEDLWRIAPTHWAAYLARLAASKKLRRAVGDDWFVDKATQPITEDGAFVNLLVLQALAQINLPVSTGRALLDFAERLPGGWCTPVAVRAVHVWGNSQAVKPGLAVERAEEAGDLSVRREYALALRHGAHGQSSKWTKRLRLADPELAPTVAMLEAA